MQQLKMPMDMPKPKRVCGIPDCDETAGNHEYQFLYSELMCRGHAQKEAEQTKFAIQIINTLAGHRVICGECLMRIEDNDWYLWHCDGDDGECGFCADDLGEHCQKHPIETWWCI